MAQTREQQIQQDVKDLHTLGYAQELFRSMGGFSNFAISFSIISILTGAVILYDYGLAWAGTAAVLIGWPLVTVFVLLIAASMGEIASAYPTAGGLYYWASRMKNKNWGWWTAWLNLIGQFAIVAGINYAAAGFINGTIVTPLLANAGVAYGNTSAVLGQTWLTGQLVTMGLIMLVQLALNVVGVNLVSFLNQVSVWWHIAIVAAVVVLIVLVGKPDISGLKLFAIQPLDTAGSWANNIGPVSLNYGAATSYPLILAFFFSLLQANWTYTGYDASAHVAEETVGAAVVGFVFLLALTTHLPNLGALFPADPKALGGADSSQYYFGGGVAVISILKYNLDQIAILGVGLGDLLAAGIAIAMWFCGLASIAAAGRMLFAFSRDDGLPAAGWLKKVSHRYRTPTNSLIAIVLVAWLFTLAAGVVGGGQAIVIVTAVSTIFLYAAYGICIYLGATTTDWLKERVWSLGRWSMAVTGLFLLIYYYGWARARFQGPRVMGQEEELTEIEREFEHAAEQLGGAPA